MPAPHRIAVPISLLSVIFLAGCTAAPTPTGTASDPASGASTPAAIAPDCAAVGTAFTDYTTSLGAAMSFTEIDAATVSKVGELPGDVLAQACAFADPTGDGLGGYVFIPDADGAVEAELDTILTADHKVDSSLDTATSKSWVSATGSGIVQVSSGITDSTADVAGVSSEMILLMGGDPLLVVHVSAE